jgi:hypothetical protein
MLLSHHFGLPLRASAHGSFPSAATCVDCHDVCLLMYKPVVEEEVPAASALQCHLTPTPRRLCRRKRNQAALSRFARLAFLTRLRQCDRNCLLAAFYLSASSALAAPPQDRLRASRGPASTSSAADPSEHAARAHSGFPPAPATVNSATRTVIKSVVTVHQLPIVLTAETGIELGRFKVPELRWVSYGSSPGTSRCPPFQSAASRERKKCRPEAAGLREQ